MRDMSATNFTQFVHANTFFSCRFSALMRIDYMEIKAYLGMNDGKTAKLYIDATGYLTDKDIINLREVLLVTEHTNIRVELQRVSQ